MTRLSAVWVCVCLMLAVSAADATQYVMSDLGTLGGWRTVAYGINDTGQVVGYSTDTDGIQRPVIWDSANGLRVIPGLENAVGYASAINSSGQIVCNISMNGSYHAARWDPATETLQYMNERPGDTFSEANAVDSSGRLVGWSGTSTYVTRAILWSEDGAITSDFCSGRGMTINDNGWVAGYSYEGHLWSETVFVWDANNGYRVIDATRAYGINESNTVVGYGTISHCNSAYVWNPATGILDLGNLSIGMSEASDASAINDSGTVAGSGATNHDGKLYAYIWDAANGLQVLDAPDVVWTMATGINNSGSIVGYTQSIAQYDSGERHALIWTPVPEPSSMLSVLVGLLFVRRKSRFRRRKDNRVTKTRPIAPFLILACSVLLATWLARPAAAAGWGPTSYAYDGVSHCYACESQNGCPGGDCFWEWGTNGEHRDAAGKCTDSCTGLGATSGRITATLTYSGGTPPDYVWIKENASVYWQGACEYCGVIANGWANTSIADTYYRVDVPYHPNYVQWMSEGTRKVKVNASSGTIARTAGFCAQSEATTLCSYVGSASVFPTFTVSITSEPSGSSEIPSKVVPPPYTDSVPKHPSKTRLDPKRGGTQRGDTPDPVDLAYGLHLYLPEPDISVYNPYGPAAVYQRNHLSDRANGDYASPGLTVGWVDNFDVRLTAESPGTWGALRLTYPNGAYEFLTPQLDGQGAPTGEFTEPGEAPYYVVGVPSGTTGQWDSVDITFRDQTTWRFDTPTDNTYMLARIANRMGRYVSIARVSGTDHRVTSVTDDSSPANTLMTFAYDGSNRLSSITDAYSRKVTYTYSSAAGTTCLLSLSHIVPSSESTPPACFSYGYQSIGGHPHLTSISFPSPTGTGQSTQTINYSYDDVRNAYVVSSLVDANANQHVFLYECNKATRVQVRNSQGVVQSEKIENFDIAHGNRSTGTVLEDDDGSGNMTPLATALQYENSNCPSLPTRIIDRDGKLAKIKYDQLGNIEEITNPRNTVTTYHYDYPGDEHPSEFPLARLLSVQEGSKTATTFTYYEPSGLVNTITGPRPDGTTGLIASYTYDSLGNVLTVTKPGTSGNVTTTYYYGEAPKLGQPLTVTDALGHVTYLDYDERGNVKWKQDAEGNETDIIYNIADQPATVIYPATP